MTAIVVWTCSARTKSRTQGKGSRWSRGANQTDRTAVTRSRNRAKRNDSATAGLRNYLKRKVSETSGLQKHKLSSYRTQECLGKIDRIEMRGTHAYASPVRGKEEPCAPDLVPPDLVPPDLVPHPPGRHKVGTRSTMNGERPYIYIYIYLGLYL